MTVYGPGQEDEKNPNEQPQPQHAADASGNQNSENRESSVSNVTSMGANPSSVTNASNHESRPIERAKGPGRVGARGTAAMDPETRQEVARKGGIAVSRNKQHMAEIGRKGGQSVSKNREHMAKIGRKGGAASRGHH